MNANLQRRVQRYGWDKAAEYYENCWQEQLKPAQDLLLKITDAQIGDKIIDTAAGTGLVTFKFLDEIGLNGNILATDISDEMVKIGNHLCSKFNYQNIEFKRMDAEELNSDADFFDKATCALGLMYFPYPEIALSEMKRVLKPGGKAIAAVWGSRKNCGWAEIFPIVDKRVSTDVCPLFFNLGEGNVLKSTFEQAGFENIYVEKIQTILTYKTDEEACDAAFLGGPVAMAYSRFDLNTREEAKQEYLKSIEEYKTSDVYEIPGEFVVCSGYKPE